MSTFQDYVDTFDNESGYLNWAAFGPLSPSVREEVFADADLLGSGRPSSLSLVAERIGQDLETLLAKGGIVRAEMRRPDGTVLASSDPAAVGTTRTGSEGFDAAVAGAPSVAALRQALGGSERPEQVTPGG